MRGSFGGLCQPLSEEVGMKTPWEIMKCHRSQTYFITVLAVTYLGYCGMLFNCEHANF